MKIRKRERSKREGSICYTTIRDKLTALRRKSEEHLEKFSLKAQQSMQVSYRVFRRGKRFVSKRVTRIRGMSDFRSPQTAIAKKRKNMSALSSTRKMRFIEVLCLATTTLVKQVWLNMRRSMPTHLKRFFLAKHPVVSLLWSVISEFQYHKNRLKFEVESSSLSIKV